ncbi:MAG: hypothetical protein LBC85_03375 [Fibromonadaceae bacterium]|nr:hypothetical protein [Fibromonadaceae bacterium]
MLIILLLSLAVFAKEKNERVSVYLHPVSLYGMLLCALEDYCFSYLTVEYPLNKRYSLIVAPSIWTGKMLEGLNESRHYLRLGSGVGIRHFTNGKADGFYLQLMPSAYYVRYEGETLNMILYRSIEEGFTIDCCETASSQIFDILGYIGYSKKFSRISIFFDAGLGYMWSPTCRLDTPILLVPVNNIPAGNGCIGGISFDVNFGIGFALW